MKFVLMFCLLVLQATASNKLKNENLIQNMPKDFKVAYHKYDKNRHFRLLEFIPKAETLKMWSEMITITIYHRNINVSAANYVQKITQMWEKGCQGTVVKALPSGVENGYNFAQVKLYCPQSKVTQKPEWMYLKAIKGNDSFYGIQKAFTHEPNEKEIKETMHYLSTTKVCDTRLNSCGDLPIK